MPEAPSEKIYRPNPKIVKPVDPIQHGLQLLNELYPEIPGWSVSMKKQPIESEPDVSSKKARKFLDKLSFKKIKPVNPSKKDDDIVLIITDEQNKVPREVRYKDLASRFELRKQEAFRERTDNESRLRYIVAKHTGKSIDDEGISFTYNSELQKTPNIVISQNEANNGRKEISKHYDEVVQEYEKENISFRVTLNNLAKVYGGRSVALNRYIDYETRLGEATRAAFRKREDKQQQQDIKLHAIEQDPKAKPFARKVKAEFVRFSTAVSQPLLYSQAILSSTASVLFYDYNPLRIVGEKTVGRLWKHKWKFSRRSRKRTVDTLTSKHQLSETQIAKQIEYRLPQESDEKAISFRDLAAKFEQKLFVDPITGRGVASGGITREKQREAVFGGLGLAIKLHLIPTVLSTLPIIRHFNIRPVEIWRMMRASNMVGAGVGSMRHFVDTLKHTQSISERIKLIAGATLAAPLFYFLEKFSPTTLGVNPVLMGDMGLLRLVSLAQKYSQEHGLEQTKHLRMMEAIETGITGAFAAESAQTLVDKVEHASETLSTMNEDPNMVRLAVGLLENPATILLLSNRHLVDFLTDPDIVMKLAELKASKDVSVTGPPSEAELAARELAATLPSNQERMELPDILTSAISKYEAETGRTPTWQRAATYENWSDLQRRAISGMPDLFKAIQEDPYDASSITRIGEKIMDSENREYFLDSSANDLVKNELNVAHSDWSSIIDSPVPTGIAERADHTKYGPVVDILADRFDKSPIDTTFKSYQEYDIKDVVVEIGSIQQWMSEADAHVEEYVKTTGQPIPADDLLVYFLKVNEGSINKALWDTSEYLKLRVRFDPVHGEEALDNDAQRENTRWFIDHIEDNYSLGAQWNDLGVIPEELWNRTYEDVDRNYDPVNKIGLGYHIFSQAALLSMTDPEIIKLMISGHGTDMYELHGSEKTRSELEYLSQLSEAQRLLATYEVRDDGYHFGDDFVSKDITVRLPLYENDFIQNVDDPNLHRINASFATYSIIVSIAPEMNREEIISLMSQLQEGETVAIESGNTPLRLRLEKSPETNESYLVVSDGRSEANVSQDKIVATVPFGIYPTPGWDSISMIKDGAMDMWIAHVASSSVAEQVAFSEGYVRSQHIDPTSQSRSLMEVSSLLASHEIAAESEATRDAFHLPWGSVSATDDPGLFQVKIGNSEQLVTLNNEQIIAVNLIYDDLYYGFKRIPENSESNAKSQANTYLLATLMGAKNGTLDSFRKLLEVSTDGQFTMPNQDVLNVLSERSNSFFNPTVLAASEAVEFMKKDLHIPSMETIPDEPTIVTNSSGDIFVITKPLLLVENMDINANVWIYPVKSLEQAQFIQALAQEREPLNGIQLISSSSTPNPLRQSTLSSRFIVDDGDKQIVGSDPTEFFRGFLHDEPNMYIFNGSEMFTLEQLKEKISPSDGGYRLLTFIPQSDTNDTPRILYVDMIYDNGNWVIVQYNNFSFVEEQSRDLLAVGKIQDEVIDKLKKQLANK